MEKTCIKRLVVISVIGAGDSRKFLPLIYRNFILPVFTKWFKVIIDDKNRMEESVKKSRLEWTNRALHHRKPSSCYRKSKSYIEWQRIEIQYYSN